MMRFTPVFLLLMLLAAVASFVAPRKWTDRLTPQVQMLLAPVARPVRALGLWATGRTGQGLPADDRPALAIRLENEQLKRQLIKVEYDLAEERRINGERGKLKELRQLCTPVAVVGGDAGARESLAVQGSSLTGLSDGMYVLYAGGIVGTLQRTGVVGGQVQLITNPGFRVEAYFASPPRVKGETQRKSSHSPTDKPAADWSGLVRRNEAPALIEGVGKGEMVARLMKMAEVKATGLAMGDRVVLSDRKWPQRLNGLQIGVVTRIEPRADAPLFAEIRITPLADLLQLREVMVLTGK